MCVKQFLKKQVAKPPPHTHTNILKQVTIAEKFLLGKDLNFYNKQDIKLDTRLTKKKTFLQKPLSHVDLNISAGADEMAQHLGGPAAPAEAQDLVLTIHVSQLQPP